ncbi:hypothetical protein JEQ12_010230 [Ovis aries]|uniref:Uncharacterized protein n=1 Tax=Ovis aries TaxID=9940 RepID=A0A835ZNP5_SHEEP|nr:hypothetical protein JEQ12_010230 [Ovis aries]
MLRRPRRSEFFSQSGSLKNKRAQQCKNKFIEDPDFLSKGLQKTRKHCRSTSPSSGFPGDHQRVGAVHLAPWNWDSNDDSATLLHKRSLQLKLQHRKSGKHLTQEVRLLSLMGFPSKLKQQVLACDSVFASMAPKKKTVKKNKADVNEMTIIVEDSPLNKLNALNGLLEGGNGLSCISSELTDASYGPNLLEDKIFSDTRLTPVVKYLASNEEQGYFSE